MELVQVFDFSVQGWIVSSHFDVFWVQLWLEVEVEKLRI